MEPVKGGRLVELPAKAEEVLSALGGGSPASYAIRFAAGFEGVMMVLSGMSTIGQVEDNSAFMADFRPLDEGERAAVAEAAAKTVPVPMEMVGTDDRFGQVGTEAFLRAEYRLTAEHIAEAAKKAIERK